MDREQARQVVRGGLEGYLRNKGINTRRAFRCLNPEHDDTHPSMSFDPKRNKCKCFACGVDYDTFDLIAIDYGLQGNDLFLKAYELFGIQIDRPGESAGRQQPQGQEQGQKPQQAQAAAAAATATDFMGYFKECIGKIGQTDYLKSRGISEEIAERFMIGFDPHYTRSTGGRKWQALIIPTTTGTFIARNTDPGAGKKDRYRKIGGSRLYNIVKCPTLSRQFFDKFIVRS